MIDSNDTTHLIVTRSIGDDKPGIYLDVPASDTPLRIRVGVCKLTQGDGGGPLSARVSIHAPRCVDITREELANPVPPAQRGRSGKVTTEKEQRLIDLSRAGLERLMSDIGEGHYCAGWMTGLEYDLWSMLRGGSRSYGMMDVPEEQIAELRQLSDDAGGWHDGDGFVPLAEWQNRYAIWFRDEHIPALRKGAIYVAGEVGKEDFFACVTTQDQADKAQQNLDAAIAELPKVEAEAQS